MRAYWIDCLGANIHIITKCPKCEYGVLFATTTLHASGIVESVCLDCGYTHSFYIHAPDRNVVLHQSADILPAALFQ